MLLRDWSIEVRHLNREPQLDIAAHEAVDGIVFAESRIEASKL